MSTFRAIEELGPPALRIAGFRLWIEPGQPAGGEMLKVTIECETRGARIQLCDETLYLGDLDSFGKECALLHKGMEERADLRSCTNLFSISITPIDQLGHLRLGVLIGAEYQSHEHRIDFEVDQTFLPPIVAQCEAIMKRLAGRDGARAQ